MEELHNTLQTWTFRLGYTLPIDLVFLVLPQMSVVYNLSALELLAIALVIHDPSQEEPFANLDHATLQHRLAFHSPAQAVSHVKHHPVLTSQRGIVLRKSCVESVRLLSSIPSRKCVLDPLECLHWHWLVR